MKRPSYMLEMEYAGAEWLRKSYKKPLSPLGAAVADCLGYAYAGLYHMDDRALTRTDWSNPDYIQITTAQELATWDGDLLMRLVCASNDMLLRFAVRSGGPRTVTLFFSQRQFGGGFAERILPLDEHVALLRKGYTVKAQVAEEKESA